MAAAERLRWRDDERGWKAWEEGLTGYPIVDAGMRQLARTGWMHNRVRMIAASFLTKDLLIDYRLGERHFERQSGRRRSGRQQRRVAVVGLDGNRRRAVFSGIQPGSAEPQIRSRRSLFAHLAARVSQPGRQGHPRARERLSAGTRGGRRPAWPTTIRSRSSTILRRANGRSRRSAPY